jgi:hypothetical protein
VVSLIFDEANGLKRLTMSESEGLRIISVAKSLEGFQRGDEKLSRYFETTILAGHTGLFLASLKDHRRMKYRKFKALAAAAHIGGPLLGTVVIPWLRKKGFIELTHIEDNADVDCNVVDYDAILRATAELFRACDPTAEEIAILGIVDLGIGMPRLHSEILGSSGLGREEMVERALGLAKSYQIVRVLEGKGVAEPVIYSPLIWGENISKAGKALSHLDSGQRHLLLELINKVRQYQGLPLPNAMQWAVHQGAPNLVDLAVSLGLLDRTVISADGRDRVFLTTPHLYGEIAATKGKDVCDRIRLFLDSIRHGQHFGQAGTGRIKDPPVLLTKLLDAGEIGPCTAIGRDYQLVERAGIVDVHASRHKAGQYVMKMVQEDTIRMVRDIISKPAARHLVDTAAGLCGQDRFLSAEETRAQLGEPPQKVREAEEQMLRNLREMC